AAAEAAWGILLRGAPEGEAADAAETDEAAGGMADRTALLPPTLTIRASSTRDPSGTPTGRPTRRSSS
ncbi:hypothetical protein ACFUC1_20575, partial [Pedococcus sp. NPDC057267]|uniref:hypothetical protein n=1 Tax=Pedococcus sp. NPDC057267 TaxID=3346077 RepID=UPI003625E911